MFNEDWKRDFLSRANWQDAAESRAGEDWALRKFSRLSRDGRSVILMQSLTDDDPRATLGHKVRDYVDIATYLSQRGFPAPRIVAEDVSRGLLLIEDFGDISLHELIQDGSALVKDTYIKAANILLRFYKEIDTNETGLPNYFDSAIYKGKSRVIEWYYPSVTGRVVGDGLLEGYLDAWQEIEARLPMPEFRFSHGDYHPHNLMVRQNGELGLIDFQGAIWAPAPYDLVNLLEDARRLVPDDIRSACLSVFEDNLSPEEWDNFSKWYDVLSAQFHCRVIGQAVRLAVKEGKTRLLDYIPNLKTYLSRELPSPVLLPLERYFNGIGLEFSQSSAISLSPDLFAKDAF